MGLGHYVRACGPDLNPAMAGLGVEVSLEADAVEEAGKHEAVAGAILVGERVDASDEGKIVFGDKLDHGLSTRTVTVEAFQKLLAGRSPCDCCCDHTIHFSFLKRTLTIRLVVRHTSVPFIIAYA